MCSATETSQVPPTPKNRIQASCEPGGLTPPKERSEAASTGPLSPTAFGDRPSLRALPPEEGFTFRETLPCWELVTCPEGQ